MNEQPPKIERQQAKDFLSTLQTHGYGIHGISRTKVKPLIIEAGKEIQDLLGDLREEGEGPNDVIFKALKYCKESLLFSKETMAIGCHPLLYVQVYLMYCALHL